MDAEVAKGECPACVANKVESFIYAKLSLGALGLIRHTCDEYNTLLWPSGPRRWT